MNNHQHEPQHGKWRISPRLSPNALRDLTFTNKGVPEHIWNKFGQLLQDPLSFRYREDYRRKQERVMKKYPEEDFHPQGECNHLEGGEDEEWEEWRDISRIDSIWQAQVIRNMAHAVVLTASSKIEVKKDALPNGKQIDIPDWDTNEHDPIELSPFFDISEIFLWHEDTFVMAEEMPLPSIIEFNSDLLSSPCMFIVYPYSRVFGSRIDDKEEETIGFNSWSMYIDLGQSMLVVADLQMNTGLTRIMTHEIPYGSYTKEELVGILPDPFKIASDNVAVIIHSTYKQLNFLKMKVADVERRETERSVRKQLERENKYSERPSVNVIKLRRVMHKGKVVPLGDGSGKTFEYQGQFWVGPHWKQQAYGKDMKLRKPMYIETYLKGPKDKPLIEKAYVVTN